MLNKEAIMEKTEKLSFKEWLENIWYHYKWMIIFIGMLVMFLLISIVQIFSTDDPDVNILHVGPMYLSPAAVDDIEATLADMSDDYNGDGDFSLNILDITVNKLGTTEDTAVNYDQNNSALQRFQTEIRAGDAVIYALDEEYFRICIEEGLLTPLDEIIDDADMPANTVKDSDVLENKEDAEGIAYGVYVSDLDAYHLSGICNFPDSAILCLRRSPDKDELAYDRTQEGWDGNRKTFVNIIKYRDNTVVKYDADAMYADFRDADEETENALKEALKNLSDDYNGDGIILTDTEVFAFQGTGSEIIESSQNSEALQKFQTELYTGDSVIYLLDKELFDICLTEGLLTPFDEIFAEEDMPASVISGCGIYLSELDASSSEGFSSLPKDTVLCLRRSPENETLKYGRTQKTWEGNRDTFLAIFAHGYEKVEITPAPGDTSESGGGEASEETQSSDTASEAEPTE